MTRGQDWPRVLERHFAFLEARGFDALPSTDGDMFAMAAYASQTVLIRVGWDWREDYPTIAIARRRTKDPEDEPYWAGVNLDEILEKRAPGQSRWFPPIGTGDEREADEILARGVRLMLEFADDLLQGGHLELLDEIVAGRPRLGVPGLDYEAERPWASSQEGVWFFTDSEMPRTMDAYLERSRSTDPAIRVVAALKIVVAIRLADDPVELDRGKARLHELLGDPEPDVRRAAASALGECSDGSALAKILDLLDQEPGDGPSPCAAAATFIAFDQPEVVREQVLGHLSIFASKGAPASKQAALLAARLTGPSPARVITVHDP